MIKNIVFDVGNIILEGTPKNSLKYVNLSDEDKETISTVIFNEEKWIDLDLGLYDFNSYFESVKTELPTNLQIFAKDVLFKSHEYRKFNVEIIELIKKLSNQYSIYILSNNNFDTYEYLKSTELNKYISGWCISAEYNEIKPNKKIYEIFFETNNLIPSECYFIDDKFDNIETGKYYGMNGFVLDWKENQYVDLINDMKKNDIIV